MLSSMRGLSVGPDDVLVTRGSQMALTLVARALLRPGDAVAVEQFGYRPAWEAFRGGGATVVPVAIDREGIDVHALTRLAERTALRAVYVTPHHQYPTTVTLKAARRLALLALARAKRIVIIEDDYDHEFHYDGRPVLPLASADHAGSSSTSERFRRSSPQAFASGTSSHLRRCYGQWEQFGRCSTFRATSRPRQPSAAEAIRALQFCMAERA